MVPPSAEAGLLEKIQDLEARITLAERFEKINGTLYKISNAVSSTITLEDLFSSIHRFLSDIIDTSNFYISLYERETDSLSFPYFVDTVDEQYPKVLKVSRTGSMTAEIIRTGHPLMLNKSEILTFRGKNWVSVPDCTVPEIWLGVPLKTGNTTIGAIVVQSYTNEEIYGEADKALMLSVAEQIAIAIEYKQKEDALKNSEMHYRAIFENSPLGMIRFDKEGSIIDCNDKFIELMGSDRGKLIGFNTARQSSLKMQQALKRALAGNSSTYEDTYTSITGGKTLYLRVIFNPVHPFQNPTSVIATLEDITQRKLVEEKARASNERINVFFRSLNDAIFVHPLLEEGFAQFIEVNDLACQRYGYSRSEFLNLSVKDITKKTDAAEHAKALHRRRLLEEGQLIFEATHIKKSGEHFPVEINSNIVVQNGLKVILAVVRDISERKQTMVEKEKLEHQLQQAQKMVSIGRLAGGVAHDFNNMLSVILGHTEMVIDQIDTDSPLYYDIESIRKAAEHSVELTRQLLAFARKQAINPTTLNLNHVIGNMLDMISRLIGEDIKLTWQPGSDVWPVRFDPSQIDQIITNLCLNARDAVASGGEIIIRTENSDIDMDTSQTLPGLSPGKYALITVRDNGCGMPKSVLRHIFEPFFTTKKVGEGTGLGLATVYGILKQNRGYINATSSLGQETTFEVFLPRYDGDENVKPTQQHEKAIGNGQETILLVEDEPAILTLVSTMLKKQGYNVLAAATPLEAIRITEQTPGVIHLILTDIVMPEMNGRDLTEKVLSHFPDVKCLFMSGYTADVIGHQEIEEECINFIQKPFTKAHLLETISQILK